MPSLEPYDRSLPYSYALGLYPAMQALRHAPLRVTRLLVHSRLGAGEGAQALLAEGKRLGIRVEQADRLLSRLSGKDNCFAAAVYQKGEQSLSLKASHLVLVNPMDAGNLGTILRTAAGLDYREIALIKPCADPHDPAVVRASMGAVFHLKVREYGQFDEYRLEMQPRTYYPFMLASTALPLSRARLSIKSPHSLVFGNEGSGLPADFAALGQPVRIEQDEIVDSLNLAVAAAIGMYAFSNPS